MTADHIIEPANRFIKVIETAVNVVSKNNSLLTVGIKPTELSISYGYIHRGKQVLKENDFMVYEVKSFKEKPDKTTAQTLLILENTTGTVGYLSGKHQKYLNVFHNIHQN